ncbi:MAG: hypothetical protein EOM17_17070 [Synergistales bacterium]|jgi:hypothetical protein|nr:lysoplasmalogenase [Verrucomicrobiota bacterium]MDD4455915.1 lysoplasmalogenase family protein [Candidatus Methanomethylophilaceae archaeon]NCC59299.1 hypothetical protein [Synergistales bacterium]
MKNTSSEPAIRPFPKVWFLLLLIPAGALLGLIFQGSNFFLPLFTLGLVAFGVVCLRQVSGRVKRWALFLWLGLALTLVGDFFLVFQDAPIASLHFLLGVGGFSLAQICWLVFFLRLGRFSRRVGIPLFLFYGAFYGFALYSAFPASHENPLRVMIALYMVLFCTNVSLAAGARDLPGSRWLLMGLSILLFSDTMIALGRFIYVGQVLFLVGPTYLASLTLIAVGASRFTLKMDFSKTEDPLPQKETEP